MTTFNDEMPNLLAVLPNLCGERSAVLSAEIITLAEPAERCRTFLCTQTTYTHARTHTHAEPVRKGSARSARSATPWQIPPVVEPPFFVISFRSASAFRYLDTHIFCHIVTSKKLPMKKLIPLSELSDDQKNLLVKIHTSIDVLFSPFRFAQDGSGICNSDESRAYGEVSIRRRDYFSRGGILLSGSGSGADRMSFARLLDSLSLAGWLHVSKGKKGARVRFTDVGDIFMREAVGFCQTFDAESWQMFKRLYSLQQSHTGMVREDDLGEFDFAKLETSDPMERLSWLLSPFLCAELVDGHSDTVGCFGYFVTEAGEKILRQKKPRRPRWLPAFGEILDESFSDLHHDAWREAFRDRKKWTSDICGIPLGAGDWQ